MLGERIRRLRLARGLTLEEMAAHLGGVVTKQALSKYESSQMRPTAIVLSRIASVFGVRTADLVRDEECSVEFVAYRKGSGLNALQQQQIEARVAESLQGRVKLQRLLGDMAPIDLPARRKIKDIEDCEDVAESLRKDWKLGRAPIANLVATLESHRVHVIEIEAAEKFDGISAIAKSDDTTVAAATVSKLGLCGERQRLTLGHELGHLVLDVPHTIDEEKAAYRFGAALLAPAKEVRAAVGSRRSSVSIFELLTLKPVFGMSAQALFFRLSDLEIITPEARRHGWIQFNQMGIRKKEPGELPAEKPQWLERSALRARAENLLSLEECAKLSGMTSMQIPTSLLQRREFMKLPLEQRRHLMAEQAAKLGTHYDENEDTDGIGGGDFIGD